MKQLFCLLVACTCFAQKPQPDVRNARFETRAYSGDLGSQIRSSAPAWFGYAIKTSAKDSQNCCWDSGRVCGCALEGGHGHMNISGASANPVQLEGSSDLAVLFRVENGAVGKIRAFSLNCPLDGGGLPFTWLTDVPARASLSWLESLATHPPAEKSLGEGAVFAIAQHDSSEADTILEHLLAPSQPQSIREQVAFWLGASRGARGVTLLRDLLDHDTSEHMRDKAVFALSISKQPEALNDLIEAAKRDPSSHIRGQAIFWLAQKAGKRALGTITDAIENDSDTKVKKQALFALSQLPHDDGILKLIEVARTHQNPEVRKQAFFWLGQSGDQRALAFIEQTLTTPAR